MSLHRLRRQNKFALVFTNLSNIIYAKDYSWTLIGKNDKTGKGKYRFSQYDMEKNMFSYSGNTFLGTIKILPKAIQRAHVFKGKVETHESSSRVAYTVQACTKYYIENGEPPELAHKFRRVGAYQ